MAEIVMKQGKDVFVRIKTVANVLPNTFFVANDNLNTSKFELKIKQEKDIDLGNTSLDHVLSNTITETNDDKLYSGYNLCNDPKVSGTDITKYVIITNRNDDDIHKCPQCDRRFRVIGHLKCHYNRAHPNMPPLHTIDTSLICKICNKYIENKTYYRLHCMRHARRDEAKKEMILEKPHACDLCKKTFAYKFPLQKHYRNHKCDEIYVCIICKEHFPKVGELMQHHLTHTDEELEKCVKCSNLQTCVCKHYKCGMCKKTLNTKYDLQKHYTTHVKIKSVTCDDESEEQLDLSCHSYIHGNKRNLKCQMCNKTFRIMTNFKTHSCMPVEKRFQCDVCKKCFLQRSYLKVHSISHSNDRPHVCRICDKSFKRPAALQTHYSTHGNEKPFQCEFCKRCFSLKRNLTIHYKLRHSKRIKKSK